MDGSAFKKLALFIEMADGWVRGCADGGEELTIENWLKLKATVQLNGSLFII